MQKNNFLNVKEKDFFLKIADMGIVIGFIPIHGDQAVQNVDDVCTAK